MQGDVGMMEKKRETAIYHLGFRGEGWRVRWT